jgi:hypothetical protein
MSRETKPLLEIDANRNLIQDSNLWTTKRLSYSGANPEYIGTARVGANESDPIWQIFKLSYDGSSNLVSQKWPIGADGVPTNDFAFSWTDRATYTFA